VLELLVRRRGGGLQNEEGRQKTSLQENHSQGLRCRQPRHQFYGRRKYRGASSGTPPASDQSVRFHYQIGQTSRSPSKNCQKKELAGRSQPTLLLPVICLDLLVD